MATRKDRLTSGIKQDILGFQVSVDDPLSVQMLERTNDLGHVETETNDAKLARLTLGIAAF